jgi:hypothetical protein
MSKQRLLSGFVVILLAAGGACLGASVAGCELRVQLDQGLVDGGDDGGCAICSDASEEGDGGGEDASSGAPSADAGSAETGVDSAGMDAGVEGGTDSGGAGGG